MKKIRHSYAPYSRIPLAFSPNIPPYPRNQPLFSHHELSFHVLKQGALLLPVAEQQHSMHSFALFNKLSES